MSRFRLRTLGAVALTGPSGTVPLGEPRLVAFLVMLAIAGDDDGVSEDELLLRLTPDATREHGRTELARLAAALRSALGDESAVARTVAGYALATAVISTDVRALSAPAPEPCAAFLPDFRLPGSPEFQDWLRDTRRRLQPLAIPGRAWHARRGLRAAAAITLVLIAAAVYRIVDPAIPVSAIGEPLLLADVQNETGDPELNEGLLAAAGITLQQSGRIRLYPRGRLGAVYDLMQIANHDTALTFELAREVAERDHVRFVLGLQVDRVGDGFQVTARLADISGAGTVQEASASASSRGDVLDALDAVLLTIRRRLGESRAELAERRLPLPQVTTASLAALRSYAEGSAAWYRGEYRLAGELWHRAVDLDTGFAIAYGALGGWHYYHHDRAGGARYYAEALTRAHRLTDREHLRLLEAYAGYRGQLDSSLVLSGLIAERYPNVSTWYNHGTGLMSAGRNEEAIAAFKMALTFDSTHVNSHLNLATVARQLERTHDALVHYANAGRLDSLALYRNNINHEWGGALVVVGRLAEAESAFRSMAQRPRMADRALGLRSLGYLALWRGRVDESIELFGQASAAARQPNAELSESRNRLLRAGSFRLAGRELEAGREVDQVVASMASPHFEPLFLAMIATSCMRLGRAEDAALALNVLRDRMTPESGVDSAAEAYVSGLVHLAEGRPSEALDAARRAGKLPLRVPLLMLEAEAFAALGQLDSSRTKLELVRDGRGFGTDAEDDWLRSHLLLGNLQLAQGDTAGAVQSFRRLAEQWRDAPTPVPDLVSARAQLATLTARR